MEGEEEGRPKTTTILGEAEEFKFDEEAGELDDNPEDEGEDEEEEEDGIIPDTLEPKVIPFRDLDIGPTIGEGAYGIVMKGKYFGAKVAVKLLEQQGDEEEVRLYSAREVFNLQGMRHPNIVNMLGISKHGDKVFIVMEWMSKGNLCKYLLNPANKISWHRRVQMARNAAHAIAYLHDQGLIHRDIKSENLVIGDGGKLKLADFGCSRMLPKLTKKQKRLTITGTRDWMAPEVLKAIYDHKVDVFGFGVVLYELITRQMPPERMPDSPFDFNDEAIKSQIPADCPPQLLELAKECCHPDSTIRPDFNEINMRLNEIRQSLPPEQKETTEGKEGNGELEQKLREKDLQIKALRGKLEETEEMLLDEREKGRKEVEDEYSQQIAGMQKASEDQKLLIEKLKQDKESLEEAVFESKANAEGEYTSIIQEEKEGRILAEKQLEDERLSIMELQKKMKELQDQCEGLSKEKENHMKEAEKWKEEHQTAKGEESKAAKQREEENEKVRKQWESRLEEEIEQRVLMEKQFQEQRGEMAALMEKAREWEAKHADAVEGMEELKETINSKDMEILQLKEKEKNDAAKLMMVGEKEKKEAAKQTAAWRSKAEAAEREKESLLSQVAALSEKIRRIKKDMKDKLKRSQEEGEKGMEKEKQHQKEGEEEGQLLLAELKRKVSLLEKKGKQKKAQCNELQDKLVAVERDNAKLRQGLSQLLDFTQKEIVRGGGGTSTFLSLALKWMTMLLLLGLWGLFLRPYIMDVL